MNQWPWKWKNWFVRRPAQRCAILKSVNAAIVRGCHWKYILTQPAPVGGWLEAR